MANFPGLISGSAPDRLDQLGPTFAPLCIAAAHVYGREPVRDLGEGHRPDLTLDEVFQERPVLVPYPGSRRHSRARASGDRDITRQHEGTTTGKVKPEDHDGIPRSALDAGRSEADLR